MRVTVVNIWVVWVFVRDLGMHMSMNMSLLPIPHKVVDVLVMNIMGMTVVMV